MSKLLTAISVFVLISCAVNAQDAKSVLDHADWMPHPVRGHLKIETSYSEYRDFSGVKFPSKILQKAGGHPTLDIAVTEVRPNAPAGITVPDSVQQATAPPVKVEVQKLAEGVWYLTGGSHHSAAVEFKDHVAVVEAPLNEERSLAVIAEVKKTVPEKPIKYVVNTHHHFDHSGGLRTYVAEGATVITHQLNQPFYEGSWIPGRWLSPEFGGKADKLAASNKKASFLTFSDKHVLSDGVRTMELHHVRGNPHNDAIILVYLPTEKLLIEADVYTPGPPNAPPPAVANPFSVNLYENIERLKLDVGRIAPIHGRVVTLADLLKAIGRTSSN